MKILFKYDINQLAIYGNAELAHVPFIETTKYIMQKLKFTIYYYMYVNRKMRS